MKFIIINRERHIQHSNVEVSVYEISELPQNEDLSMKRRFDFS